MAPTPRKALPIRQGGSVCLEPRQESLWPCHSADCRKESHLLEPSCSPKFFPPQHPFVPTLSTQQPDTAGLSNPHCLCPPKSSSVPCSLIVIPIHKPQRTTTVSRHHLGTCRSNHSRAQGTLILTFPTVPSSMPTTQQELLNCHHQQWPERGSQKG